VIFLSFQMSKLMHCFLHWNYFVKTFGKINLWILVVCYFSFSLSSKVHALYDCNRQTLSGNYTYCSPLFIISHGLMV